MPKKRIGIILIPLLVLLITQALQAQKEIPPPRFGQYTVGDDYFLANYSQLQDYWARLAQASDRVKVVEIGKSRKDGR